jgi:cytochrome P450
MQDSVLIPKGTSLFIPIKYFNICEAIWGSDAKQFVPERWLKEKTDDCKNSGSNHLYTFSDGPRICLGKVFAMAEFKTVLLVLVRNFSFEFPGGPDTQVVFEKSVFLPRPKVAGESGCVLPMRIRQIAK